ncbi:TPA: N-6 DNA methylase [Burkholderia vietnamiensis]|uniref:N-6 DNA methylase n=1 Tax=Burkholderia vietnamiensis TaxID=60552 RepID=UPI001CF52034|nr:N-6 DNA methylase [Burkholderia vietnamiensis]MCA8206334.1 SAM-dependent methyltransferase [Burkholderia vietnamiensis]HDR8943132.1 N-6 DNA methylase [Burkholderia vietnamiensis]HDR9116336.1 N-6 DNA methylase [Burkholderia vietnamiensis]HDR9205382.1 N-6 DNA methylase [Burkholderia vietnamiensis]
MTTFDTVRSAATTGDPRILHDALPKKRKEALEALAQGLDVPGHERTERFQALLYGGLVRFASDGFREQAGLRTSYHGPMGSTNVPPSVSTALFMLYATAVRYSEPFADVLGDLYTQLLAQRNGYGWDQYFTPSGVAKVVADLGIDDAKQPSVNPTMTINDPTCGAGGLLLAVFRNPHGVQGLQPEDRTILAQDIDPLCCAMTAMQFCMNAFVHQRPIGELIVRCGNTLAMNLGAPLFFHAQREGWGSPATEQKDAVVA